MSDLELLADTMEEWSTTSGDHHMLAAAAIRQLIKLQAALQHSGEPVVNEPTFIDLTLEEIEGIIKSNITITDYRLYEGVYAVATDIETALKNKNSSAGKGGE
jgi:uncharacterized membrane protein YccC